ncbi:alpha/beta hydrolase [Saccharibacillus alkalitolerans]|uniref:Alpha/beta fold hydrolase n=1 Tax=Saccharibacillus alkalitolerans TaxID=2705290 RepID=A0ABX0F925_9BACL|nr:alpha/beta fold hydrolase [Saccharibacillus alkalitolerans]NGZ77466.1 alpha/beta fold hydrolase [Saccharibacillus alkalitolerans]
MNPASGTVAPSERQNALQTDDSVKEISPGRRRLRNVAVALFLSILFFLIFCFVALHAYIAWVLSNPTVAPLYSNPKQAVNMDYKDVTFPAADGSRIMQGWYIPADDAESKKTIVLSHGYGANREETWIPMYDIANYAHRLNFNVIMFDYGFASHGSKEVATGGKKETQQLLGAVQYAKQNGAEQVVVWGFSMGGGTALQSALISDDIDAMILDSAFLLQPDTLYHNIRQNISLPRHPSLEILQMLFPILNGTSLHQIPYREVEQKDYPIPIFFIHGTEDTKAPYQIAEQLAANQTNPNSRSWIVQNSHHELIFREHPREYLRRVSNFLGDISLAKQEEIEKGEAVEIPSP